MSTTGNSWTRYFVYRKECLKSTWTLRLLVFALAVLVPWLTRDVWAATVGWGLVCDQDGTNMGAEAILVENFDLNYLVFERAGVLRREGAKGRILVPVPASPDSEEPNLISAGIVELMGKTARLGELTMVSIRESEPISLNTAYQLRAFLQKEKIHSVLVVTPALRSRRSAMVYGAVFTPAGIRTHCLPVIGVHLPDTWMNSWHGVEGIVEQYIKLAYYRIFILPRVSATPR